MKNSIRHVGLHIAVFIMQGALVAIYWAREEYALSMMFGIAAVATVGLGRIAWKSYRASIARGIIQPAPVKRDADG
ncbi:hypothetical protein RAS12_00485 [Achromobacter seleniivolatilans]|uniref:Uncharacterized protein n=1 Tax=Achromobacter seleniivolatilans TaxID=3047478 RepID=A0ABY9M2E7_9BURK|nr:hypothetical protein [Achromobacter sp. R39]WMD20880.1 hypothetical protein RAS12_00485 [Achromobacter sp. R39]